MAKRQREERQHEDSERSREAESGGGEKRAKGHGEERQHEHSEPSGDAIDESVGDERVKCGNAPLLLEAHEDPLWQSFSTEADSMDVQILRLYAFLRDNSNSFQLESLAIAMGRRDSDDQDFACHEKFARLLRDFVGVHEVTKLTYRSIFCNDRNAISWLAALHSLCGVPLPSPSLGLNYNLAKFSWRPHTHFLCSKELQNRVFSALCVFNRFGLPAEIRELILLHATSSGWWDSPNSIIPIPFDSPQLIDAWQRRVLKFLVAQFLISIAPLGSANKNQVRSLAHLFRNSHPFAGRAEPLLNNLLLVLSEDSNQFDVQMEALPRLLTELQNWFSQEEILVMLRAVGGPEVNIQEGGEPEMPMHMVQVNCQMQ